MGNPSAYYRENEEGSIYAKNFLSSSFGISPNADFMTFADSLRLLDTNYNFAIIWWVLIFRNQIKSKFSEYMIESIVLLKSELGLECIDWDGLLYLYQSNDFEPSANTPLNSQIKNWNEVQTKNSRQTTWINNL